MRKIITPVLPVEDNGIRTQYAIEAADWISHPDVDSDSHFVLTFRNEFVLDADKTCTIHVSADQRYELLVDGQLISRGPDRCGLERWSFASYDQEFAAGRHVVEAHLVWLADKAPAAQVSLAPGFILAAEGLEETLNTGTGKWQVASRAGIDLGPGLQHVYHVIGPAFIVDGQRYHAPADFTDAVVVAEQEHSETGIFYSPRTLYPTSLPEQKRDAFAAGKVRANNSSAKYPVPFCQDDECLNQAFDFVHGPIEVAANTTVNILWDLENYYCGYTHLTTSGGAGASVKIEWAESLYRPEADPKTPLRYKDNRDEVAGKVFWGFGDTFRPAGDEEAYRSFWWRAGRYVLVTIQTAADPIRVEKIEIETTRYPLENEAEFNCSDPGLEAFIPIGVRGLQMCSHETLMDCPYYEQMMYVGDSRLELMTWYAISRDTAFPKRCLELFDWSRWRTGFVAERYPSYPYQLSLTFSTIWVYMLHDFMMWRDEPQWLKQRLTGMRCLLENFRSLIDEDGLLHALPGWSFIDWVDGWRHGMPLGCVDKACSIVNLQFVYALQKAAEIEAFFGDTIMAERNRALADAVAAKVVERFWVADKNLFSDDLEHESFSEHAQCLGLLTGTVPQNQRKACFQSMLESDIDPTTIYFSFYLLETFRLMDRGDLILGRMDLWKNLLGNGFKTTVEKPEPSRSDCHAWGAHPIFHFHSSLAGISPDEPGFGKVRIAPSPGELTYIASDIPHPRGRVEVDLTFSSDDCAGSVKLPNGVTGTFVWQGGEIPLKSGSNDISC